MKSTLILAATLLIQAVPLQANPSAGNLMASPGGTSGALGADLSPPRHTVTLHTIQLDDKVQTAPLGSDEAEKPHHSVADPSSVAMLGLGLLILAALRRHAKRG